MKKIYAIGRDKSCDIVIPDNTDNISRLHATIRVGSNGKIYLMDQSLNGTYVNGIKISSNVEIPITRNDIVSFAHIYNLDWNQIPKTNNRITRYVFIALCIIIISGIIFGIKLSEKQTELPEYQEEQTELSVFSNERTVSNLIVESLNQQVSVTTNTTKVYYVQL